MFNKIISIDRNTTLCVVSCFILCEAGLVSLINVLVSVLLPLCRRSEYLSTSLVQPHRPTT